MSLPRLSLDAHRRLEECKWQGKVFCSSKGLVQVFFFSVQRLCLSFLWIELKD